MPSYSSGPTTYPNKQALRYTPPLFLWKRSQFRKLSDNGAKLTNPKEFNLGAPGKEQPPELVTMSRSVATYIETSLSSWSPRNSPNRVQRNRSTCNEHRTHNIHRLPRRYRQLVIEFLAQRHPKENLEREKNPPITVRPTFVSSKLERSSLPEGNTTVPLISTCIGACIAHEWLSCAKERKGKGDEDPA